MTSSDDRFCVRSEKPIHNDKEQDREPKFLSALPSPKGSTTMDVPLSNEILEPHLGPGLDSKPEGLVEPDGIEPTT